ncbi:tetratricopeptide repeat protein [Coleofasciculus sp. FACHB-SPT36]|uniref:tetratricopeptide repeat protein n=1 Tax=Coleofasciculus sp. FACHB-SPT36 TaxID=2692790 RepID=UPI00168B7CD1|nr:tetratricopeptide repeat protein [Coleofasciculus sp. FACHB-SPT36]MBD2540372.1 tetratricopeptide repeat protein [Coleofasciculus sp. FACHB-SPT36]
MIRYHASDWEEKNEIAYEDLLVAIEASEGILSILIAVCDDNNFREQIIARYEAELAPEIRSYRVTLARGEPSLRAAIAELVQKDEYLQNQGKAVLTITGTEQLYFLKLGAERSEQEVFFGYLQWTREGLREFPYPIVLWINNQILSNLSKKAPDFWSWRKGVFRFESKKTALIPIREISPFRTFIDDSDMANKDDEDPYFLPIEDLQQLIQQIEQQRGTKDPNLAVLYSRIGNIYKRRVERGECQDYQKEQELAIEYFGRAIALEKELRLLTELATDLNNLALLYESQGRYSEAEPLYLQAIDIDKKSLPADHPGIATDLNNLAGLYESQGRYSEAEPLYLQALDIDKKSLPADHPEIATHLNNLAGLYRNQGRYSEAEPLYLQAIDINKKSLPADHPHIATGLNNLAELYRSQGRYSEAEPLYLQALEISDRALGANHPQPVTIRKNLERMRAEIASSNSHSANSP